MKESTVQKELFEEFGMPKHKKKRQQTILPKNYKPLSISHEQVVFIAIAAIMLMVLIFSLGVERGRRLVGIRTAKESVPSAALSEVKEEAAAAAGMPNEKYEKINLVKNDTVVERRYDEPSPPVRAKDKRIVKSGLFTIQVIAYRSKKSAQRELEKLSEKGYKPFIITGGGYYQICVGEYADKDKSKNDFLELKKNYKDSFIRKR